MLHRTKKIITFYRPNDAHYPVFDGQKEYTITLEQRKKQLAKPYNYNNILVPYTGTNMKDDYTDYIKSIDNVFKCSDGKIDMYRTGSVANTALVLFNQFNSIQPESIEPYEFDYISMCGGGVRIAEKYTGTLFKYDIKSYYPSLLMSNMLKIPISKGTPTKITQDEFDQMKYIRYGVYHVKIDVENPKLFTELKSNKYTHYEVNLAKSLSYKITVLGDAMIWENKDCVNANKVFGEYVDYLYSKKKCDPMFKLILNSLWGVLCQSYNKKTITCNIDELDISDTQKIISMMATKNGMHTFKIYDSSVNRCKTNWARMKPFILGLARVKLHRIINNVGHENIKYAHTDSLISCCKLPDRQFRDMKDKAKIGYWKNEGQFTGTVKNKNKVILEEI